MGTEGHSRGERGESHTEAHFAKAVRDLAAFRYALRKFLRFSESAARQSGITPKHHQLLLGVAGFTGAGSATISELAEFLQERHNSVVGLVDRAVERGLVRREQDEADRRRVVVYLTPLGREILAKLAELHREEVRRIKANLFLVRPEADGEPSASNPRRRKSGNR